MNKNTTAVVLVTTLALGTPGLIGCSGGNEYVAPPPPKVTVARPLRKKIDDYLYVTGRTEAVETVEVKARVEGVLLEVLFEEGAFVEEGTPLYKIDPREYQAREDRAEADIAAAEAELERARAKLSRLEEAVKTNAVSELDVLEAKAVRDGAIADLAGRRADLINAQLDLEYTRINAPITGRVGENQVDPGNLVGTFPTLLTTIVRHDPMYVSFDISERDLLHLMERASTNEDQGAERNVEALRRVPLELALAGEEGYPHKGTFHYTDQGVDPETGTLLIRGIFENPRPYQLLPGFFARLRTPIPRADEPLLVSERAFGSDQTGRFVLVVGDDDVVQHRPVVVGARVEGMLVVESGLEDGDWVVVNGLLRARPGATVAPERSATGGQAASGSDAGR